MPTPWFYHSYNETTRRNTTIEMDSETGLPLIRHTQDVKPIVEHAKRLASSFDKHRKNPEGWTHVASIPMVIWQHLNKLGITKDQNALNAWLDGRDQRVFRTDNGRKL